MPEPRELSSGRGERSRLAQGPFVLSRAESQGVRDTAALRGTQGPMLLS